MAEDPKEGAVAGDSPTPEEDEGQIPEGQESLLPEGGEPEGEKPESDVEKNWRALREKVEFLEKQLQEKDRILQQINQAQPQTQPQVFGQPQPQIPAQPQISPQNYLEMYLQQLPPLPDNLPYDDARAYADAVRRQAVRDALMLQTQAVQPILQPLADMMNKLAVAYSEMKAQITHPDFKEVVTDDVYNELKTNPMVANMILSSPDPGETLYKYARMKQLSSEDAIERLRKQIQEETLKKMTAEKGHQPVRSGTPGPSQTITAEMIDNMSEEQLREFKKKNPDIYQKYLMGEL